MVIEPESYGADPTGEVDSAPAFQAALDDLAVAGGGSLLGLGPSAVYRIDRDVYVTSNFTTLDGRGATIRSSDSSAPRINADGAPQLAGGAPQLDSIWIKRWRFGLSNDTSEKHGGISLSWCERSGIVDVIKRGKAGGAMRVLFCRRTTLERVSVYGCSPNAARIGILIYHGADNVLRDCHVSEGQFWSGIQIKGAHRTLLDRCTVSRCNDEGGQASPIGGAAFLDRGDAPYRALAGFGPYPYPDLGWDVPDNRRESRGSLYRDCWVFDCGFPQYGLALQEFSDATILRCYSIGRGVRALRTVGGKERAVTFDSVIVRDANTHGIVIQSKDAAPFDRASILRCEATGNERDGIRIVNGSSAVVHGCTSGGNGWADINAPGADLAHNLIGQP